MQFDELAPTVAVDIGNTTIQLGYFPVGAGASSSADRRFVLPTETLDFASLLPWLQGERPNWRIISVHRGAETAMLQWLQRRQSGAFHQLLKHEDLPLTVQVDFPGRVGLDRLAAAVAVNQIREPARPAMVIDAGTALTVDLVGPNGAFLGGAIAPGAALSAKALHDATDQLPLVEKLLADAPPPALGKSTEKAIQAGLFWGVVGTARELTTRLAQQFAHPPHCFITGGGGKMLADCLGGGAEYRADLVLAGIIATPPPGGASRRKVEGNSQHAQQ